MLALNGGRPEVMNLKDIIEGLRRLPRGGDHPPHEVLLTKARERAHILLGLAVAVANIDEVIKIIRTSPDPKRRARS